MNSQFDQEMLQEFVVEAEEHLYELEPNLLSLEQHPDDIQVLNDCFRNMHSIKGASAYMGFTRISTLAHALENLFDMVRRKELSLDVEIMNKIFSGVDRLKSLLKEVSQNQVENTEVKDLIASLEHVRRSHTMPEVPEEALITEEMAEGKPSGFLDEDLELKNIYIEEMNNLFNRLEMLENEKAIDEKAIVRTFQDMERMTNYVGFDEFLEVIKSATNSIETAKEQGKVTMDLVQKLKGEIFSVAEPVLGIDLLSKGKVQKNLISEEDKELYDIFIDFVREFKPILSQFPDEPDETWLSSSQRAIDKIKSSAYYMDYQNIVNLMDEWSERLTEILTKCGHGSAFDSQPLRELWNRLLEMLPELAEEREITKAGEEMIQKEQAHYNEKTDLEKLESALDEFFGDMMPPAEEITTPEGEEYREEISEFKDAGLTAPVEAEEGQFLPEAALLESVEHAVPDALEVEQSKPAPIAQTVRVELDKVERLMSDVGELVVLRSGIVQLLEDMKNYSLTVTRDLGLTSRDIKPYKEMLLRYGEHTAALTRVAHQIQDSVMKMRMLPVSHLFNRYPRMVRDLSQELDKKVAFHMTGTETTLDKQVIEQLADPLMHIIRNAVDHGIEIPELRERLGKPSTGRVLLSASQEGNFVVIKVSDDGKGLDREAILRKATSLGFVSVEEAQAMSDERVWDLIFHSGISTARDVTELSGRGVGMNVVKKNIEKIGGSIRISSLIGHGTDIIIRIPLTLAIIPVLMVKVGSHAMSIPLAVIQETIRAGSDEISPCEGFEIMSLRQKTLPVIRLSKVFRGTSSPENPKKVFIVVVRYGDIEAGLAVDSLIGQQEIVIKPLADYLTEEPGFSGATILGDGSIGLILDIPAVLERAKSFVRKRHAIMEKASLNIQEGEMYH